MTADEIAFVTKRQGQFAVLIEMGLNYQQIKNLALANAEQSLSAERRDGA